MVLLKLNILFNDGSEKERILAEDVNSHSCKSGYVKDLLWDAYEARKALQKRAQQPASLSALPDFNF